MRTATGAWPVALPLSETIFVPPARRGPHRPSRAGDALPSSGRSPTSTRRSPRRARRARVARALGYMPRRPGWAPQDG
ncbi:MAG: hypothetical protein AVDCRST_MAG67-4224 [uncultured Solirubrobacteraceae bacterium]|uniref:Uncharacterized protein n=1 Tax=uncultured Solirubrobacteraceae bacterium TaxID=1162706 RepID=A0A6J4TMW8_9ACTN|nr:MAG: hypothetical protein AVDCRST_MAG67-4224 [uncultured Solirubrobacteraceae bacterium]